VIELKARVSAVLRRVGGGTPAMPNPIFTLGALTINFTKREVMFSGHQVKLTPTEYNLLVELALSTARY